MLILEKKKALSGNSGLEYELKSTHYFNRNQRYHSSTKGQGLDAGQSSLSSSEV